MDYAPSCLLLLAWGVYNQTLYALSVDNGLVRVMRTKQDKRAT